MESSTLISKLTKIFICKQQVLFKKTEDEVEFLRRRREYVKNQFSLPYTMFAKVFRYSIVPALYLFP